MRQFILTCMVFLCTSHSAVAGYLTDKQIAGLIWHFVETRCPAEAPKYLEQRPSSLEGMGYFMVGGEYNPKVYEYTPAPWELFATWTNNFIHFAAFSAVGNSQVGSFIDYLAYLEDGVVSKLGYDADGLRQLLVADNDLLKCLMPHEDEFSAIRGKQMGYMAGQLMCKAGSKPLKVCLHWIWR